VINGVQFDGEIVFEQLNRLLETSGIGSDAPWGLRCLIPECNARDVRASLVAPHDHAHTVTCFD
jgi:hypothetical protein